MSFRIQPAAPARPSAVAADLFDDGPDDADGGDDEFDVPSFLK